MPFATRGVADDRDASQRDHRQHGLPGAAGINHRAAAGIAYGEISRLTRVPAGEQYW